MWRAKWGNSDNPILRNSETGQGVGKVRNRWGDKDISSLVYCTFELHFLTTGTAKRRTAMGMRVPDVTRHVCCVGGTLAVVERRQGGGMRGRGDVGSDEEG